MDQQKPLEPGEDLVDSLRNKLQNLSPFSTERCIYRVPERLRHQNERAYTPQVVSIGPLHHDKDGLKAMEEQKLHYLKSFLERTNMSLEDYVKFVKVQEEKVRSYYAESFETIRSNKFVQMVVVDAAFVVELLWKNHSAGSVEESDCILKRPLKVMEIRLDLMLLENQLPFFILEDIFKLAKPRINSSDNNNARNSLCSEEVSLIQLTHKFFKFKAYLGGIEDIQRNIQSSNIKHFVDFFRKCHVPPDSHKRANIQTLTIPSVTELYNAGVKFKVELNGSLLDIKFRGDTLVIPHLRIRKATESFFLNLLAFEQCHQLHCYINDYVFIIDRLVNSTKAVQLLTQSGVIESKLSNNQEVVTSIGNLSRGSILHRKHFHFNDLCNSLNDHCSNRCNIWIATFKHRHFSSPLTVFAIGVATAIFVLTLLQTICSCGVQFK